jgi:excinuclease UvrABC nuclease subunit
MDGGTTMYFLYRHFSKDKTLLYIGISKNVTERSFKHKRQSSWFDEVVNVSCEPISKNLDDALVAEKSAIKNENPKFNVMHNKKAKIENSEIIERNIHRKSEAKARREYVRQLRKTYTWTEIGKMLNISPQRAQQLGVEK